MAEAETRSRARRLFWPVTLLAVAGALVLTVAGTKNWVSPHPAVAQAVIDADGVSMDAPGVTALGLVLLAFWGVVLVVRGLIRRVLLVMSALAALAAFPVLFVSAHSLNDGLGLSGTRGELDKGFSNLTFTAWPWIALVGLVATFGASVCAVVWCPQWPEMGRRYDAPTAASAGPVDLSEAEPIELWKTISEGHDPTSDGD